MSPQLNWRPTPFDYIKWTSFLNLDDCLNLKKMFSTKDDEMRFRSAAATNATADARVKWMSYYPKTVRQPPASYLEINKRAFVSYAIHHTCITIHHSPRRITSIFIWFDDSRSRSVSNLVATATVGFMLMRINRLLCVIFIVWSMKQATLPLPHSRFFWNALSRPALRTSRAFMTIENLNFIIFYNHVGHFQNL